MSDVEKNIEKNLEIIRTQYGGDFQAWVKDKTGKDILINQRLLAEIDFEEQSVEKIIIGNREFELPFHYENEDSVIYDAKGRTFLDLGKAYDYSLKQKKKDIGRVIVGALNEKYET